MTQGSYAPGEARQFANEAQQAVQDAQGLRRALAEAGGSKEDLAALEQVMQNLKSLGSPNAYNDPGATQELAARAMDKLQTLEFNLRKKAEKNNQLFLNGSDQVPPAFRGSVEEYYRSLAKKGGGGTIK
jgi:type II secretory pathway pseudopilin PulG